MAEIGMGRGLMTLEDQQQARSEPPPPPPMPTPRRLDLSEIGRRIANYATSGSGIGMGTSQPPAAVPPPQAPAAPEPDWRSTLFGGGDVSQVQRAAFATPPESETAIALRRLANAGLYSPQDVAAYQAASVQPLNIGPPPIPFIDPNVPVSDLTPDQRAMILRNAKQQFLTDPLNEWRGSPDSMQGTPHMNALQAAAQFVSEPFRLASDNLRKVPLYPGVNDKNIGQQIDAAPAPVRIPANFALDAAPYVAADIATGGALTPLFAAQAGLQAASIGDEYASGRIDGRTALSQLALTVGPMVVPVALRAGGEAVQGLRAYADSPEGAALVAKLQSERGGGMFGEKPIAPEGMNTPDITPPAAPDITAPLDVPAVAEQPPATESVAPGGLPPEPAPAAADGGVSEPPPPPTPPRFGRENAATYPGQQPIVQGVSLERQAAKPPMAGGNDFIGRRLTRDAEQRIETFEARAKELGAPEPVVKAVALAYRDGSFFASTAKRFENSSTVMQNLAKVDAWVQGKVPDGVITAIGRAHLVAENAVRLNVEDQLQRFKNIDNVIAEAKPALQYVGPERMRANAMKFQDAAIVTHPEWWGNKPPALEAMTKDLQQFQNGLYKVVQAIDPNAAPALDTPYLRTVWDVPESNLTSAVTMPIGRASVTKARTFADPFEAMASNKWPYELKAIPVSELVESSANLAARQIGTQLERKMVLQRFGTTDRRPGMVAFRNPNYAGWYAPREIVNFIDQLNEPGGSVTRATGAVTNPIRNTIFGVGDIGVFGTQVLELVSTRGPVALAGAVNRALERIGLGADLYRYSEADLPRALQRAAEGLPQGSAGRISDRGAQTLIGMMGENRLGKALGADKVTAPLERGIDALNNAQFTTVLTPLRNMAYEGNLLVSKLLGRDITNPAVRRAAAENASAFGGASLGAIRRARREGESALLGAPAISRDLGAQLVQVAKLNTPEAWTTLASIGATVYGLGSLLNMTLGSGRPVPLDPRNADWATVQFGGRWQTVNGQRVYVGGRKIRLIPQASLVRTIGKSFVAVQEGKPERFVSAWEQLAYSRATPGLQAPASLLGTGFDNNGRFRADLPFSQRVQNLAPLPIVGQEAMSGQVDSPASAALTVLGLNNYPGDTAAQIKTQQDTQAAADARAALAKAGYTSVGQNVWDTLVASGKFPPGYGSFDEFRAALIQQASADGTNPDVAQVFVDQLPAVKQYRSMVAGYRAYLRESDPNIARLALIAGEVQPSVNNLPALLGQQQ